MLAIIILIFVGRKFYQLAKKYEQNTAWIYPILGILSYYAGEVIIAFGYFIYLELTGNFTDVYVEHASSEILITLVSIGFGIFTCWGFYQLLDRSWYKKYEEKQRLKPRISDIGKPEEEPKPQENFLVGRKDLGSVANTPEKKEGDWRF